MTKTIALFLAHALAVIAVLTTFGILGLQREDQEAQERFTGVLEENVTLQILDNDTANDTAKETGYLDELLNAFNEEYAQYGIKAVDANMGAYTDLEKLGPAGYGPDVVYQANDVLMRYALNKHIQPLPVEEMEAYSQIPKGAWDAYRMQMGEAEYTFAVPVNVQEPLLYYRKDLAKTCSPKTGRRNGTTTRTASPTWWKTGRIFTLFPPRSKPPPTVRRIFTLFPPRSKPPPTVRSSAI